MFRQFQNSPPVAQFFLSIFVALLSLLVFSLVAMATAYWLFGPASLDIARLGNISDTAVLPILQFYQIVQSTALFVIPPFIIAWLFSSSVIEYLKVNRKFSVSQLFLIIVIVFSVLPLINLLAELNSHITFPSALASLERSLKNYEELATKQTEAFLNVRTLSGLALNILMVGIIPALGEELMFRGVIQRIFSEMTRNAHWGIIISAFIFSAIHMQFYGFFPRMLLGMILGYLFLWSGSIWVPIVAHFLNNTMAVIGYFLVNAGKLSKETMEVGSPDNLLPLTFLSTFIFFYACYIFYKKSANRMNGEVPDLHHF